MHTSKPLIKYESNLFDSPNYLKSYFIYCFKAFNYNMVNLLVILLIFYIIGEEIVNHTELVKISDPMISLTTNVRTSCLFVSFCIIMEKRVYFPNPIFFAVQQLVVIVQTQRVLKRPKKFIWACFSKEQALCARLL